MRMIVLLPMALLATSAAAQTTKDVSFEIQNFTKDEYFVKLTVAIKNNAKEAISHAFVECGFLNVAEKAIDTGVGMASNVEAGQTAYVQVTATARQDIEKAACRISQVQP